MKKYLSCLIGILLSLSCFAQTDVTSVPSSLVPNYVLDSLVDELIVKDHLVFELHEKDSILVVYKHDLEQQRIEIGQFKLNEQSLKTMVTNLEKERNILKDENKDLKKQVTKGKIKSFVKGFVIGVAVIVVYLVVHK